MRRRGTFAPPSIKLKAAPNAFQAGDRVRALSLPLSALGVLLALERAERVMMINLDDLTLGQLKEIARRFGGGEAKGNSPALDNEMLGQYVIVRCRDAGVHAGVLDAYNGRECVLTEARRLWYWRVKGSGDFLNAIALAGVHPDSKLSAPVARIHLTETCEIIQCTAEAEKVIRAQKVHNG